MMTQPAVQRTTLSDEELSLFFMQISLMVKSGILPAVGVGLLAAETASVKEQRILTAMQQVLEEGRPFYEALTAAGCFPAHALRMVQIGEETGRLDQVLTTLAAYYEQEHDLKQTLRQAVIYPAWLAVIIVVVTFVLVMKVLPVFEQVLSELGSGLTPWAASLMNLGVFTKQGAIVLACLLLLLAIFLFVSSRSQKGQNLLRRLLDKLFFHGRFSQSVGRERFASAMALSLASGLTLDQALANADMLVDDAQLSQKIAACGKLLEEGVPFATAVEQAGIFGGLETGLLAAGFKAGASETVMQELARRYHNQTEDIINRMLAKIEPILIIILVLVVGMLLLSVMLPLLAMMNAIGN